jgi:hypothetical protein
MCVTESPKDHYTLRLGDTPMTVICHPQRRWWDFAMPPYFQVCRAIHSSEFPVKVFLNVLPALLLSCGPQPSLHGPAPCLWVCFNDLYPSPLFPADLCPLPFCPIDLCPLPSAHSTSSLPSSVDPLRLPGFLVYQKRLRGFLREGMSIVHFSLLCSAKWPHLKT